MGIIIAGLLLAATAGAQVYDPSKPADSNYSAKDDPNHPLKNPNKDPGEGWAQNKRNDGSPNMTQLEADLPWGELYFDDVYPTQFDLENKCDEPQTATVFLNDLPYLVAPPTLLMPAKSRIQIPAQVVMPPEPPPPPAPPPDTPPPADLGWGWVAPPTTQDALAAFHQPNYEDIRGEIIIWHPWQGNCKPKREVYTVSGHIHFRPPNANSGPQRLAQPDLCQVYWHVESPPAQLGDQDCTPRFRELARLLVNVVLPSWVQDDPQAWAWLPDIAAIDGMDADALLAMKVRALQQLGEGQ